MTGGWKGLWWVKNEPCTWVSVATVQIPCVTAGSSPSELCSALIASIRLLCFGAGLLSQEGSSILLVLPMPAPQQALGERLWIKKWIMCNSLEPSNPLRMRTGRLCLVYLQYVPVGLTLPGASATPGVLGLQVKPCLLPLPGSSAPGPLLCIIKLWCSGPGSVSKILARLQNFRGIPKRP